MTSWSWDLTWRSLEALASIPKFASVNFTCRSIDPVSSKCALPYASVHQHPTPEFNIGPSNFTQCRRHWSVFEKVYWYSVLPRLWAFGANIMAWLWVDGEGLIGILFMETCNQNSFEQYWNFLAWMRRNIQSDPGVTHDATSFQWLCLTSCVRW